MSKNPALVYFGHHKCASTYVNQIVANLVRVLGMSTKIQYLPRVLPFDYHEREAQKEMLDRFYAEVEDEDYDFLCHGNADQELLKRLETRGYKGFHVIRDPRDIVISGYFSHKNSHPADPNFNPWLIEHREVLNSCNEEEGIHKEIEYCSTFFERLANWNYQNPNVLECKFEGVTTNSLEEFTKIFNFLGISFPEYDLLKTSEVVVNKALEKAFGVKMKRRDYCPKFLFQRVMRQQLFKKKAKGRKKGEEDTKSHFRKGLAGDWENYFNDEHKAHFKEQYSNLVIKLGYAENEDW